jgi:hypothetical protein
MPGLPLVLGHMVSKALGAQVDLHFNKGSYWVLSTYLALCISCKAHAMIITEAGKGLIQDCGC